jgi:hypothetical protein
MGVAYCEFSNNGDGTDGGRDNTALYCYNMGRPVRVPSLSGGWKIEHRGWGWISTQDSNKALLHPYSVFVLPGEGPDSTHAKQYRPVSDFNYLAYACRPYGDGARCTVPSDRYPGSLIAIYLTKRGGIWYRRIPDTVQPALVHLDSFLSPDRKVWCRIIKDATENDAWCGTKTAASLATVKPDGTVTICNNGCLQNWDDKAPVLGYGHRSELNAFSCSSEQKGITCTVSAGAGKGKGFSINVSGITQVG